MIFFFNESVTVHLLILIVWITGGPPRPGMLPAPPMGGPPMMPMMGPPPHGMMPGGPGRKIVNVNMSVLSKYHQPAT